MSVLFLLNANTCLASDKQKNSTPKALNPSTTIATDLQKNPASNQQFTPIDNATPPPAVICNRSKEAASTPKNKNSKEVLKPNPKPEVGENPKPKPEPDPKPEDTEPNNQVISDILDQLDPNTKNLPMLITIFQTN
ncbi:MAG: hypothetical protein K2X94_01440 [Amoebophilaceae bacterium]|nr:hypothetical protein [Amoebophilaceae bacterium]